MSVSIGMLFRTPLDVSAVSDVFIIDDLMQIVNSLANTLIPV